MYSRISAVSSALFAGMVNAYAENTEDFLRERDAFEKTPDVFAGLTVGAAAGPTAAQRAAVAAVIAQFRHTEERAAVEKTLIEGEQHDTLKGERPLDPKLKELRREAAVLRANELDLRALKDTVGKECTEATRDLLEGQFACLASVHARGPVSA